MHSSAYQLKIIFHILREWPSKIEKQIVFPFLIALDQVIIILPCAVLEPI